MLKFPCSVITAAKTAHRDYDFGPGFRLEERIDAAEAEGIEARRAEQEGR